MILGLAISPEVFDNVDLFVDEGVDSYVYKLCLPTGIYAIHRYKDADKTTMELYREAHNKACEWLENNPRTIEIEGEEMPIMVNPIEDVYESKDNTLYTSSLFIDGPTLRDHCSGNSLLQTDEILISLNNQLWELAEELERECEIKGIFLLAINIKIVQNEENVRTLILTDLCMSVKDFARVNSQ